MSFEELRDAHKEPHRPVAVKPVDVSGWAVVLRNNSDGATPSFASFEARWRTSSSPATKARGRAVGRRGGRQHIDGCPPHLPRSDRHSPKRG
jgi:hypothetical protein